MELMHWKIWRELVLKNDSGFWDYFKEQSDWAEQGTAMDRTWFRLLQKYSVNADD